MLQEFIQLPVSGEKNLNLSTSSETVRFLTRSTEDYGTLLCFASNSIGYQTSPCVTHIIPSGESFAPQNYNNNED